MIRMKPFVQISCQDFNSVPPNRAGKRLRRSNICPSYWPSRSLKRIMRGQKECFSPNELLDALSGLNQDGSLDKQLFRDHLKSGNSILGCGS